VTEAVKPRLPADGSNPVVTPTPEIELLVERARRGDPRAFRELMDSYRTAFYGLARRYVGAHEDADDVLQESFVKVYQNLAGLTQSEAFFPWARRIIVNTALDHLRRRRRSGEVEVDGADHPEVAARASAFEAPDRGVERREFLRKLERALRVLPPRQREIVVLHDVEGLSTREVAERSGIPAATVRSNLFYGREKLRRMLVEHHT
jgi:RNA polymerase sigma-70 factor (ECF subfamily)